MARNKVEVLLTARDEISGTLKGIVAGFAATLGGLAVAAISIGHLKDGIADAAKSQVSMISTASDVATLMAVPFTKALSEVKNMNTEIARMAAALPGETAGYVSIANAITATMAKGAGGSVAKLKADTLEMTRLFGFLAASKGADMGQAGNAVNKLLSGTATLGELKGNDIFQNNPVFMGYIKEGLASIGKQEKDWESLNSQVKIKLVSAAGKKSVNTNLLNALDGTTESLVQGIKSSLFDPQIGIFGFLRELKGLGSVTALDSVRGALQALTYMSGSATKFLAKYGISFDPMEILAKGFDFAAESLNAINAALSGGGFSALKMLFRGLDFNVLKKIDFKKAFKSLAEMAGTSLDWLRGLDTPVIGQAFNGLLDMFAEGLKNFDATKTGQFLSDTLGTVLAKSLDIAKTINWGKLNLVLEDALLKLVNTFLAVIQSSIGKILGGLGKEYSDGWEANKRDMGNGIKSILPSTDQIKRFGDNPAKSIGDTLFGTPQSSLPTINGSTNSTVASTSSFSPVINITGVAQNLQETADYVLSAMNSRYMEYQAGVIA